MPRTNFTYVTEQGEQAPIYKIVDGKIETNIPIVIDPNTLILKVLVASPIEANSKGAITLDMSSAIVFDGSYTLNNSSINMPNLGTQITDKKLYIDSNGLITKGVSPSTTNTIITSSGTYNVPTGCTSIIVRMVGGGGGGTGSTSVGTNGGNSIFTNGTDVLQANGGLASANVLVGGLGGNASGGTINVKGARGYSGSYTSFVENEINGGDGADSRLGSGGNCGIGGEAATGGSNGVYGGGGGGHGGIDSSGGGGGSGGYVEKLFSTLTPSYTVTIGTGGSGGSGILTGGNGGDGVCIVTEFY